MTTTMTVEALRSWLASRVPSETTEALVGLIEFYGRHLPERPRHERDRVRSLIRYLDTEHQRDPEAALTDEDLLVAEYELIKLQERRGERWPLWVDEGGQAVFLQYEKGLAKQPGGRSITPDQLLLVQGTTILRLGFPSDARALECLLASIGPLTGASAASALNLQPIFSRARTLLSAFLREDRGVDLADGKYLPPEAVATTYRRLAADLDAHATVYLKGRAPEVADES
jgi:hypothetical protein